MVGTPAQHQGRPTRPRSASSTRPGSNGGDHDVTPVCVQGTDTGQYRTSDSIEPPTWNSGMGLTHESPFTNPARWGEYRAAFTAPARLHAAGAPFAKPVG